MTIIIEKNKTPNTIVAKNEVYAQNAGIIHLIRKKIRSLLTNFTELNELTRNCGNYPVREVCAQLVRLNESILSLRILINELDAAAKKSEVAISELQAFKETLDSAQEYYDEAAIDFYELTSGADLDMEPAPKSGAGESAEDADGEMEISLELGGRKLSDLSGKEKMEMLLKLSQITAQLLN